MTVGDLYIRWRTALESRRPIPADVSEWLLAGLQRVERDGGSLDEALGFKVCHGEAWRHPIRQIRRAEVEATLLRVADLAGGRGSRQAGMIAESLQGVQHRLPSQALDLLLHLHRRHERDLPASRSAIYQILQGRTRAQRDGVVVATGRPAHLSRPYP